MKILKKYRKLIVLIFVIVVLIIFFLFTKAMLYPDKGKSVYGNRLNGIDSVPITKKLKNEIIDSLQKTSGVKKASIDIRGKVINIIFDVDNSIDVTKAEGIANDSLTKFSEKEESFYDIQYFISQSNSQTFPIIGYKNKTSSTIVWTIK